MFPLRDENPTIRFPIATVVIISVTVLAWVILQGLGTQGMLLRSLCYYGLIPGDLFALHPEGALMNLGGLACPLDRTTPAFTLITHMFMHGAGFTSSATCGFCGCSATTSRMPWGGVDSWRSICFAAWVLRRRRS